MKDEKTIQSNVSACYVIINSYKSDWVGKLELIDRCFECEVHITMSENQKDFKFDKRAASYDVGFEGKFSQRFYSVLLTSLDLITFVYSD